MNWSYVLEKNANEYPEKDALVFEGRRTSYRHLNERVNALAKGLLDMGLGRGDIAAILMNNCSEYLEIPFAVNKIGAIWLPINFRLAGEELVYILNHSGAKILFSEVDFGETLASIRDRLLEIKAYIGIGKGFPSDWKSYDDIVNGNLGKQVPHAHVELDDLERLMYTSGTTAHPKGAMITYGNLYWKCVGHVIEYKITPEDKVMVAGPLYHTGAMDVTVTDVLYMGGTVVILRKFDVIAALKLIQDEKITCVWLAPVMINMMLQEPTFDQYDVSSLRLIVDGGEKMPLPLITKVMEKFPSAWFADAFGMTETVSGDTFLRKDKAINKLGSVGKPLVQLRVRIVDDNNNDVPPRIWGEILLRGPKVFKGYWKNEEATAQAFTDGWFHTGDVGYLDEEGYLYIEDRKKDMIISGGENVSSAEVERVIYELPQVLEAAIVGIPHPRWLEVPKAFIVLKAGQKLSEEDIIEHCTRKLAKFKVPKEIEFISALPRNPSGKVLKRELRRLHEVK